MFLLKTSDPAVSFVTVTREQSRKAVSPAGVQLFVRDISNRVAVPTTFCTTCCIRTSPESSFFALLGCDAAGGALYLLTVRSGSAASVALGGIPVDVKRCTTVEPAPRC
jgi:hypothetical protein